MKNAHLREKPYNDNNNAKPKKYKIARQTMPYPEDTLQNRINAMHKHKTTMQTRKTTK